MTATALTLQNGLLLQAGTPSILTAPQTSAAQIVNALFVNNDTVIDFITIYLVRKGSQPGAGNLVIANQGIPPQGTYISPELWGRNLSAGDTLWGFATNASVVTVTVDGVLFT